MEEQVVQLLLEQKRHVVFVESCTGGMLASAMMALAQLSVTCTMRVDDMLGSI